MILTILTVALSGCGRDASKDLARIEADVDARIETRRSRSQPFTGKTDPSRISVFIEYFEVPRVLFDDYLSENPVNGNDDRFRRQIEIWLRTGQAKLHDMMAVQTESGQQAKTESFRDILYPTETQSTNNENDGILRNFNTRKTGAIMTIDATHTDAGAIKIILNSSLSSHSGPPADFSAFQQTDLSTTLIIANGSYVLAGTGKQTDTQTDTPTDSLLAIFIRADSFQL